MKTKENIRLSAIAKLHPRRGKFDAKALALLARLVEEKDWAPTEVTSIVCDPNHNMVVGYANGMGVRLGPRPYFVQFILDVSHTAGLSGLERRYLLDQVPAPGTYV